MAFHLLFSVITILTFASAPIFAYDPSPLDEFCVAVPDSSAAVFVNGKICKNPKQVTAEDFYLSAGYHNPGNTSGPLGTSVNPVDVNRFPGLNTMGISFVRTDFAPNGFIPPHTHPRATEVITVLEGSLYVGFVGSNRGSSMKQKLYAKVLKPGDIFILPMGLIHFQLNVGKTPAVVIATFNSQNFGVVTFGNDFFATDPLISPDLLARSFQLDKKPKVLKDDDPSDAMAPAPSISPRAPPKKEEDKVVKEDVVENDAKEKEGAVVDHDSVTKNSSLGNLFKENQEGKDPDPETVKVPDVSEVTTKEVEKTIPEDSSLKKAEEKKIEEEEEAKGKKTAATEEEEVEVVGEIAEKKHDEANVVTPEETNLDHIKPRVVNPDEKKPETQQQQQQEQEEKEKKETDESLKPAIVHPPPATAAADQEKFATPKEKPEETFATTAKEEKKPEAEQIQGEEQQTLNK